MMKLKSPKPCKNTLKRTRLLRQISAADAQLLVLHGKAGYGKTELARQYCEEFAGTSAWYILDEADNEPERFDRYLDAVFRGNLPGYGEEEKEEDISEGEGKPAFSHILLRVDWALEAGGMPFLLIFDGAQTIKNEEILMRVRKLTGALSEAFRLCLITRGHVPDFLSRFVMDGSCLVLDEPELAFSREEEETLARSILSDEKSVKTLSSQLHKVLCGWPAGIMLALLFVRKTGIQDGIPDWPYLVRTSMIGGFLNFEMFQELSEEEREFLIRTADLEELEAEACSQILGKEDSQALIGGLLEENILCCERDIGGGGYNSPPPNRKSVLGELRE